MDTGVEGGWRLLDEAPPGFDGMMGGLMVKRLGPGRALARLGTGPASANIMGALHGGFLAAAAEPSLFLPLYLDRRVTRDGALTVDFSLRFMAGGTCGTDLEMEVELLRETGRLAFIRGLMRQNGNILVSYEATMRKLKAPSAV